MDHYRLRGCTRNNTRIPLFSLSVSGNSSAIWLQVSRASSFVADRVIDAIRHSFLYFSSRTSHELIRLSFERLDIITPYLHEFISSSVSSFPQISVEFSFLAISFADWEIHILIVGPIQLSNSFVPVISGAAFSIVLKYGRSTIFSVVFVSQVQAERAKIEATKNRYFIKWSYIPQVYRNWGVFNNSSEVCLVKSRNKF